MIEQLLAMLRGANTPVQGMQTGTTNTPNAGWEQFGRDYVADFLQKAASGNVKPSTSSLSKAGYDYAKAPDMSQFANQSSIRSLITPHAQRPQQQDLIGMPSVNNEYLRSLLLGV